MFLTKGVNKLGPSSDYYRWLSLDEPGILEKTVLTRVVFCSTAILARDTRYLSVVRVRRSKVDESSWPSGPQLECGGSWMYRSREGRDGSGRRKVQKRGRIRAVSSRGKPFRAFPPPLLFFKVPVSVPCDWCLNELPMRAVRERWMWVQRLSDPGKGPNEQSGPCVEFAQRQVVRRCMYGYWAYYMPGYLGTLGSPGVFHITYLG
ncbi:hypothetical protein LZ30DRAFT_705461, partial [Colletotrichum cereale]